MQYLAFSSLYLQMRCTFIEQVNKQKSNSNTNLPVFILKFLNICLTRKIDFVIIEMYQIKMRMISYLKNLFFYPHGARHKVARKA